jgi:uncharacterized protein YlzI (FlbEa/FlbD family)
MVRESAEEVVGRIVEFRRTVNAHCLLRRIAEPLPTEPDES